MAWDLYEVQDGYPRDNSATKTIRESCTTYSVDEREALVAAQSILDDDISSIPIVVELSHQRAKVKKTSDTPDKKYETNFSQLTEGPPQHTLMHQKTAETLAHTFGAVVLLATSLTNARGEIQVISSKQKNNY